MTSEVQSRSQIICGWFILKVKWL